MNARKKKPWGAVALMGGLGVVAAFGHALAGRKDDPKAKKKTEPQAAEDVIAEARREQAKNG
jgi:hypothetical protein